MALPSQDMSEQVLDANQSTLFSSFFVDPEDCGSEDLEEEDEADDASVAQSELLSRRDVFLTAIRQANVRLGNLGLALPPPVAVNKSTPMGLPSSTPIKEYLSCPSFVQGSILTELEDVLAEECKVGFLLPLAKSKTGECMGHLGILF
jgi:hypothetical protein